MSGSAVESPHQIEHSGEAWPALPAPEYGGWDMGTAVSGDPEPSYAALPTPETQALSTQAEIDDFLKVAWETAPAIEAEPAANVPALPPAEAER